MRILCAVRGGPESEKTIEYAVALAKRERARLVFLYVVSLRIFASSSEIRAKTIEKELSRMGEFILLMAQARAATEGVSADTFVRQGDILEQIPIACKEMNAKILLLGKAQEGNEDSFFDAETQDAFVEKMRERSVRVILI